MMRNVIRSIYICCFAWLITCDCFSQQAVEGFIKDERGRPIQGGNIIVKGTAVGTITDHSGLFKLDLPDGDYVLIFSYIKHKTLETKILIQAVHHIKLDVKLIRDIRKNRKLSSSCTIHSKNLKT